ncbi:MAG: Hsp20 family protein [Rickettsiales bacterium]
MTNYDLTPLMRSTIGFDNLSHMIDSAFKIDERTLSYPPYNIAKLSDDDYEISMAVAGFKLDELNITVQQNTLIVSGATNEKTETDNKEYLHRGIATRNFERKFSLADHVKVIDAQLADGMLTLSLKREIPEESKPRTITINNGDKLIGKLIHSKPKKAA